jgi:hypothetical protein
MTLDMIETAARAVAAGGVTPSSNNVLAWLKARGERVSKRTVLKLMKMLPQVAPAPAVPIPDTAPVVAVSVAPAPRQPAAHLHPDQPWLDGRRGPAPIEELIARRDAARVGAPVRPWRQPYEPPDIEHPDFSGAGVPANGVHSDSATQVERCRLTVQQAEVDVEQRRSALRDALLDLLVVGGIVADGQRYGPLAPNDPARDAAKHAALTAQRDYEAAWSQLLAAKATLTAAQTQGTRAAQEAWVKAHRPDLVLALQGTTAEIASATDERSRFVAKHEHQRAMFAYQQAVAQAPVGEG